MTFFKKPIFDLMYVAHTYSVGLSYDANLCSLDAKLSREINKNFC